MIIRNAEAVWEGNLKDGKGIVKLGSGAYEGPYSYHSRFEEGTGTNPEELIGAAHAGCFSMALSADLSRAGFPPNRIHTTAKVHFEKLEVGFTIVQIDLHTEVDVPGLDQQQFVRIANGAKENCPVSRVLKGTEINLEAKLIE
ncbi:MAG: OsmC family peroxiredoxin [Anaerolineales bacterium]|nr:OsmC family peroxiredoxin [Anaerolineales bacterium]